MIQRKFIYDSTQKKATPKKESLFLSKLLNYFRTFVFPKTESPTEIGQY